MLWPVQRQIGVPVVQEKKVEDTVELFTSDTLKGGAKKPELVKARRRRMRFMP